jgi:hypothetical protein
VLGYHYAGSPAVVDDGSAVPDHDPLTYHGSARPGARLPHVWLADGSSLYDHLSPAGLTLLRRDPLLDVTRSARLRPNTMSPGSSCSQILTASQPAAASLGVDARSRRRREIPRQRGIALVPHPSRTPDGGVAANVTRTPWPRLTWLPAPPAAALDTVGADTLRIAAAPRRARHLSPGTHSSAGVLHTIAPS